MMKKTVVKIFVLLSRIVFEKIKIILYINVLSELYSEMQSTVITISHRLYSVKNMDRIIILENGNIVEDGTHEELLKNQESKYSQLWNIQCK